jgi:hypothetical protein
VSDLSDAYDGVYSRGCVDYSDEAEIPGTVYTFLEKLVVEVDRQAEALQNLRELLAMRGLEPAPTLSRVDALKLAREHVEAMSTNSRGYQDGVKLDDKVRAMERFARFLMGEGDAE